MWRIECVCKSFFSSSIQTELQEEHKKELAEKEAIAENKKTAKFGGRPGLPSSTERRAKIRNSGKENQPRAKNVVKGKVQPTYTTL